MGFNGDKDNPSSILIKNNNLHLDILINENTEVGKIDKANNIIYLDIPVQVTNDQ